MDFNDLKQARLVSISENSYIRKFIEKNNFSNSFIADNYNVFNECLSSLEICNKCTGLENCKQRKKGEVIGLTYDGFLNNNINYCKHYLKNEKINSIFDSYVYSDIPFNYLELTLSNIDLDEDGLKQLFVMCYDIFEGKRKRGIYIYGDLGVGKTYMCIALANSLVLNNKKVAFIKTNDFVTTMSKLIREDVNEYEKILRKVSKAEYLMFDDIGSENVSEFSRDRLLFNILDYRMENGLTTIYTSNLDKVSLLKHFTNDSNQMNAKRLMERIDITSENYCLEGLNKRRLVK